MFEQKDNKEKKNHTEDKEIKEEQEQEQEEQTEPDYSKSLEEKENEIKNIHGQLVRLKAEFDNYRKRAEKEKTIRYNFGKQTVLLKLVDLVDIFDNAMKHASESNNVKDILSGIKLIHKEFVTFLFKEGIKQIETIEEKFDPVYHEIVGYEFSEDSDENTILSEVQRGYVCDDEVIRPAKVVVAKKKTESDEPVEVESTNGDSSENDKIN